MTQLKLDDSQDLAIENNKAVLTINNSDMEIRQRLIENLLFFKGEWFLDRTFGIPYFQMVFVKETPPAITEAVFKEAIIATDGVSSLVRFAPLDLTIKTRQLAVSFDVITINGTLLSINQEI